MSPIRRKCRFVLRNVDRRKTILAIILEELGGKIMFVNKEGVRMIAAKEATCDDLSTSLSASNTGQEADDSIFPDAQDDGDDGVCFI